MNMDENDEFEKYFKKASKQTIIQNQNEEPENLQRRGSLPDSQKKSRKKSKDRRGANIKQIDPELQSDSTYQEYLSVSNKQTRTSISNPFTDIQSYFLKPDNKFLDASSTPNIRSSSLNRKNSQPKIVQNDTLTVNETHHYRRSSLTPEELTENKLQEIENVQKDGGLVVRSFLTSPKGLVNRGDSFKRHSDKKDSVSSTSSHKLDAAKIFPRRLSDAGKRASIHIASSATISDLISANVSSADDNETAISLEPRCSIGGDLSSSKFTSRHQFVSRPSIEITKCYYPDEPRTPDITIENANTGTKSTFTFPKPGLKRVLSHEAAHLVVVVGDHRVGKTSLVTQFLTSEYLAGLDVENEGANSQSQEKVISVSVDNIETMLKFIDTNIKDIDQLQKMDMVKEVGAYLVMYSITDVASYDTACELARYLCNVDEDIATNNKKIMKRNYAVIMVGNKEDLVRNRKVLTTDARDTCNMLGCKFIEVSAGLNHKLDELLVGIVYQVRLNDKRKLLMSKHNKSSILSSSSSSSFSSLIPAKSSSSSNYFGWFKKLFGLKNKDDSSQCDNMQSF